MPKTEFRVILKELYNAADSEQLEAELNELGKQGFRIVSCGHSHTTIVIIMAWEE